MTEAKKPKHDDLRPDHAKLIPTFEGYKLSLDSLVVKEQELSHPVRKLLPSNSQWSFQHALFFSRFNGLCYDYWQNAKHVLAIVLADMSVCQATWNENAGKFCIVKVADLELEFEGCFGEGSCVNATISFPSKEYALVSEGAGRLLVFFTADRANCSIWKRHAEFLLSEVTKEAFVIVDSKIGTGSNGGVQIDCVVQCVQKVEQGGNSVDKHTHSDNTFQSVVYWLTLAENQGTWSLARTRKLVCDKGIIKYCALNTNQEAVCVISTLQTRFTYDSERPVEELKTNMHENSNVLPEYLWSQTVEEVIILFPNVAAQHFHSGEIVVEFFPKSLSAEIRGHRVLLEGELASEIKADKSSWSLSSEGRLKITLAKQNPGTSWSSLIPTDQRGAYRKDLDILEEICDRLEQFTSSEEVATKMEDYQQAFNTEQLEECDVPESQMGFLTWLDGNSHNILRQADVGGHPFLFSLKCDPRKPPFFCLRHLVDGVLWQVDDNINSDRCWTHFATFNAYGYIQAGNANRKYCTCATDCSYALVAEERKRVRIYWQPEQLNNPLINRRTGEKVETRATQQMVTLDRQEEIWGVVALPEVLFVLTESRLLAVKVKENVNILPASV
uniref:NudC domain-containing protein 1 n=1 Tax=Trichuris muris TaxID=70415 RepID=A0A5S6QJR6_TRIMR